MNTRRDLNVLFVLSALGVGGAETWIIALLEYFARERADDGTRVRIDLCLTGGHPAHFDERARALGARLYYLQYSRLNLPAFVIGFRKILREGSYDVVHDHQDLHAGWHFLMGLGHLPKVRVVHLHNTYLTIVNVLGSTTIRRATLRLGKWLVSALATDVLGTSQLVLEDYGFNDADRPRPSVVRCGFRVAQFREGREAARKTVREEFGWPAESKVMLFVGRLDGSFNQKNHPFAVNVAAAVAKHDSRVRLLLAGGGDSARRDAEANLDDRQLECAIKFIGARDDVPRLMLGADLLLFPSVAEGLGMVAVEAQAAGLPVLASDRIPHECEVVPGAVTFIALELGVESWALHARSLLERSDIPHREWNEAVQHSSFSIEQSALRLADVYEAASSGC